MTPIDARRVAYQTLSRRLTAVAEHIADARTYLAHAAQDAPLDYNHTPSLERSLIGLNDLAAFLRDLATKAHNESEAS